MGENLVPNGLSSYFIDCFGPAYCTAHRGHPRNASSTRLDLQEAALGAKRMLGWSSPTLGLAPCRQSPSSCYAAATAGRHESQLALAKASKSGTHGWYTTVFSDRQKSLIYWVSCIRQVCGRESHSLRHILLKY